MKFQQIIIIKPQQIIIKIMYNNNNGYKQDILYIKQISVEILFCWKNYF